jgi:hypothetical protein
MGADRMTYDVRLAVVADAAPAPGGVALDRAVDQVLARWLRIGDQLSVEVEAASGDLVVRLPYAYYGREAREPAKLLHAVVHDLERATGRRAWDPQLSAWLRRRSWRDTVAVLNAVVDFQAAEHVDSPGTRMRRDLIDEMADPRFRWRAGPRRRPS